MRPGTRFGAESVAVDISEGNELRRGREVESSGAKFGSGNNPSPVSRRSVPI